MHVFVEKREKAEKDEEEQTEEEEKVEKDKDHWHSKLKLFSIISEF